MTGIQGIGQAAPTQGSTLVVDTSNPKSVQQSYSMLGALLGGSGNSQGASSTPAAPAKSDGGGIGGAISGAVGAVASIAKDIPVIGSLFA